MSKTDNHTAPQFDTSRFTMMSMSRIELNEGQLAGLPANPRGIKQKKFEKLKTNIERYPEMLVARSLLVYPLDDDETQFIIIGGNMRYRAMLDLGHTNAPVFIIPRETSVERLMAYTILDNGDFGDWDWDLLANEWPEDDLNDWGIETPGGVNVDIDDWFKNLDTDESNAHSDSKIIVKIPENLIPQRDEIIGIIKKALADYDGIKFS
ncbi:MAG: hypothetical protein NC131_07270 [Roseburia sp.]|nr:hypothetical protein [Roseburia sp.]